MLTAVPGKVVFSPAITTLTSITISWTAPSDGNSAVVGYKIRYTFGGTDTTVTTSELKFVLEDLTPSTRVQFSVSAVSACGTEGEPSITTEYTIDIRK